MSEYFISDGEKAQKLFDALKSDKTLVELNNGMKSNQRYRTEFRLEGSTHKGLISSSTGSELKFDADKSAFGSKLMNIHITTNDPKMEQILRNVIPGLTSLAEQARIDAKQRPLAQK